ncbi:hypothetical protein VTI74DRAFT_6836 [Chaetomium olivicolor]
MATTPRETACSRPVHAPRNAVCARCWELCFSTNEFRELCQTRNKRVSYAIEKKHVRESASDGCGWCSLIDRLDEDSNDVVPPEFRGNTDIVEVRVGEGMAHKYYTPKGPNRYRVWVNGTVTHLTAFVSENSPVAHVVTARPLHIEVDSGVTFDKIHQWLADCSSTHPECRPLSDSPLPTRLIEVAPEGVEGTPRIASTKGRRGKYAALSYCWGGDQSGMTLQSNFASRLQRLDTAVLSKTVRQAIQTTKRMGLRYIWIDAICIIQDDDADRTTEISQMCEIYRQACITIVAANATSASDGFLENRSEPSPPTQMPFWGPNGELSCVFVHPAGWHNDSAEPINTRCWTLQERLLSSRLVMFASHTIQLQCQRETVNLGYSLNIPAGLASWRLLSGLAYPLRDVEVCDLTSEAVLEQWKQAIQVFSGREITRVEERLVALSGLAQAFHGVLRTPYLAGLWSGPALPAMLLWETYRTTTALPEPPGYLAPSWSWASRLVPTLYRFNHRLRDVKPFEVEVLSATTKLRNPSLPFGAVSAGRIVLRARLQPATFVPPTGLVWETAVAPRPAPPPPGVYGPDFMMPDCVIDARLDGEIPYQELEVVCLPLTSRAYKYDGVLYKAVDGLLLQRTADVGRPLEYQRMGCFFGAMQDEFARSEREELVLV